METNGTPFSTVYNRFLNCITDDMYMETTPEDTITDIRHLLINAIPGFEFPRINLYDYTIDTKKILESSVTEEDFIIGIIWDEVEEGQVPWSIVDCSSFKAKLTSEEVTILAYLMVEQWILRQVASVENTRMKYSGTDFKMTSQANHLSKLLSLLDTHRQRIHHLQRLYKRREINEEGTYQSTWYWFGEKR